ncbi:MAG: enoyl-CoA hydratase/isomerase family protein [Myxococcales bacterium]|nr:enoyl-CoA hydratase/isomerase family protein [Myxococcales bacterium]
MSKPSSPFETLRYDDDGDIATVRLLRPRINVRQLQELERVCDALTDVSKASLVIFRGASQGIDFTDFDPKVGLDIHGFNKWEKLVRRVEQLEKVTAFFAEGDLVGGGFQLLLACDVRSARAGVQFRLPEVQMGFLPGMATWRLARYVGVGHARRLILRGVAVGTDEAIRLGLIDDVREELDHADLRAHYRPETAVAAALARRLLLESGETQFEDALGNLLAAQFRAISQSAFLENLKR